jgi:hypothetical protein
MFLLLFSMLWLKRGCGMDGYRLFGQRPYTKVLDAEEVRNKWTLVDGSVIAIHAVFSNSE